MQSAQPQSARSPLIHGNLELARRLERGPSGRSAAVRVSDFITRYLGTLTCVVIHFLVLVFWFVANSSVLPWLKPFDPFPFGILTLIVSSEGVLLAIFVLIS